MKFLVHEGKDATGPMCWYESGIDVIAGNTIAVPGPSRETLTVDSKVVSETMGAEPIKQVWLFCTRSNVSADAPGVIRLTVADRQNASSSDCAATAPVRRVMQFQV
jgi:hypothetical protein